MQGLQAWLYRRGNDILQRALKAEGRQDLPSPPLLLYSYFWRRGGVEVSPEIATPRCSFRRGLRGSPWVSVGLRGSPWVSGLIPSPPEVFRRRSGGDEARGRTESIRWVFGGIMSGADRNSQKVPFCDFLLSAFCDLSQIRIYSLSAITFLNAFCDIYTCNVGYPMI